MSYNFLDKTGLAYFYDKIKTIFAKKSEIPTKTSQLTNDSHLNYSIEKPSGTIDDLAAFTSGKPGITGSISLTKKSSGIGSEIPAGWYNYYFSPHRTGSGGDNINYGNIILTPMTFSGKSWILRRASNATTITEVKAITTNDDTVTTSKNGLMLSTDKTKVDNIDRLLTNEDLNTLLSTGTYYGGGGNTVSNKPTGVDAFGLKVFRTAAGFWTQELIEGNTTPGARWTRQQSNNTWSSWTKMLWTDTTYTSKTAASGGTDVSLVTTGEKYTWNNKQNALSSQTAYTSKGTSTKVPQITTNSLGQVTNITEVNIDAGSGTIGSSNDTIENIVSLTKAEYDALQTKETKTLYNITDDTSGGGFNVDDVYPVGSIYMSVNSTNPSNLFGGTWTSIPGRFLIGAGQGYTAGDTGGSTTNTIAKENLPNYNLYSTSHNHGGVYNGTTSSAGLKRDGDAVNKGQVILNTSTKNTGDKTITVSSGGSGTALNNMPPYLVVYIWKRVS